MWKPSKLQQQISTSLNQIENWNDNSGRTFNDEDNDVDGDDGNDYDEKSTNCERKLKVLSLYKSDDDDDNDTQSSLQMHFIPDANTLNTYIQCT